MNRAHFVRADATRPPLILNALHSATDQATAPRSPTENDQCRVPEPHIPEPPCLVYASSSSPSSLSSTIQSSRTRLVPESVSMMRTL